MAKNILPKLDVDLSTKEIEFTDSKGNVTKLKPKPTWIETADKHHKKSHYFKK